MRKVIISINIAVGIFGFSFFSKKVVKSYCNNATYEVRRVWVRPLAKVYNTGTSQCVRAIWDDNNQDYNEKYVRTRVLCSKTEKLSSMSLYKLYVCEYEDHGFWCSSPISGCELRKE